MTAVRIPLGREKQRFEITRWGKLFKAFPQHFLHKVVSLKSSMKLH